MPRYEYHCPECAALFVISRPIEQRDAPVVCPACGTDAFRLLSLPTLVQHAARLPDGRLAPPTERRATSASWAGHGHSHGPNTPSHDH